MSKTETKTATKGPAFDPVGYLKDNGGQGAAATGSADADASEYAIRDFTPIDDRSRVYYPWTDEEMQPYIAKYGSLAQARRQMPTYVTVGELKNQFAFMPQSQKQLLADTLVSQGKKPTESAMRTMWGDLVEGAAQAFINQRGEGGPRVSPWDMLRTQQPPTGIKPYGAGGSGSGGTQTQVYQLDLNNAKQMLNNIASEQGFGGKFTAADYREFMNDYNKKAKSLPSKYGPGFQQQSVFNPSDFARDWLWTNKNVADKTARGAALTSLNDLRALNDANGLNFKPEYLQGLVKQIATGKETLESVRVKMNQQAVARNYPWLADLHSLNPNASVRDLLSPEIGTIASVLEVDDSQVSLSDPLLGRVTAANGQKVALSRWDLEQAAMNDPRWQKTQAANVKARDAATGLARAFGFGI